MTFGIRGLQCRTIVFLQAEGAFTSPYTAGLSWIKEASSIQYPIGERNASSEKARMEFTLWPVSKTLVALHEGRSEIPRAPSQRRPAAMNKEVQIEDVCGVGEDRSSWRISGSRWPRTHHRHEAFDEAPTPAQGFSRKTCLKGTTLWSKCFRVSRAAAAEMMVAAEVPRMSVHSATVARRKRGHSESGIRCRGSSSFRVILVAVKPVNFGRLKLNCAVMLS